MNKFLKIINRLGNNIKKSKILPKTILRENTNTKKVLILNLLILI